MGEKNVEVNKWLGNKKRFADLFNGCVFDGKDIVKPEDLQLLDRESDFVITGKSKKRKTYQRYRDIVMAWKNEITLAVLACETQDRIHYGMPVRNMLYDAAAYTDQMSKLWEERKESKGSENEELKSEVPKNGKEQKNKEPQSNKKLSQDEYLSRFEKGQRLQPVITLVFYYGDKEWDGSKDLYGLFGWNLHKDIYNILEKYVPNYCINLIEPRNVKDLKKFHTDLQLIFEMLQYKNNKNSMIRFINNNRDYFSSVTAETYNVIRVMFDLKKVLEYKDDADEKECCDMCKAFDDYFDEGVQLGVEQGIEQGIEKGESLLASLMSRLFLDNRTEDAKLAARDEAARRRFYREYGLADIKEARI